MSWSARGELGTMTAVEAAGDLRHFNASAMIAGFYVNELIVRLLHRYEAHPELFSAYESILAIIDDTGQQECGLRYFELSLLEALGFGLVLDHDVVTGKSLAPSGIYQYVSERGPSAEEILPGNHVSVHGQTLRELAVREISTETALHEAKLLLRQELGSHLGEKPLASRALYQSYLRNRGH